VLHKLVLAWDPDYAKLTPSEARRLEKGRQEIAMGEVYTLEEVENYFL